MDSSGEIGDILNRWKNSHARVEVAMMSERANLRLVGTVKGVSEKEVFIEKDEDNFARLPIRDIEWGYTHRDDQDLSSIIRAHMKRDGHVSSVEVYILPDKSLRYSITEIELGIGPKQKQIS